MSEASTCHKHSGSFKLVFTTDLIYSNSIVQFYSSMEQSLCFFFIDEPFAKLTSRSANKKMCHHCAALLSGLYTFFGIELVLNIADFTNRLGIIKPALLVLYLLSKSIHNMQFVKLMLYQKTPTRSIY